MRVVSKIRRLVAGKVVEPGEEFDADDAVARLEVETGRAEQLSQQQAQPKAAAAPQLPAQQQPAQQAQPKASAEVKPVSTQSAGAIAPQGGDYGTRDLKAKA